MQDALDAIGRWLKPRRCMRANGIAIRVTHGYLSDVCVPPAAILLACRYLTWLPVALPVSGLGLA
ncbi:hypothetical protein PPUN12996_46780 [Pseudomonas putida]|nr:hypothetical protein PPUN12996_46780 [Pseudomonas putida]